MTEILEDYFPGASIECASDLLAAARALWGDTPGIVAILGTGSNSCSYNGVSITGNVPPGGYILGDEGGGADELARMRRMLRSSENSRSSSWPIRFSMTAAISRTSRFQ